MIYPRRQYSGQSPDLRREGTEEGNSLRSDFFDTVASAEGAERRNHPFSAAQTPTQPTRQNFLRPSLLFPSETHLKTCGKIRREMYMENMCKRCGKRADFLRITARKTVQKPVDILRGRGGKLAENTTKFG